MFKRAGMVGGAVPIPSPLAAQQAKAANSSTVKLTPPTTYGEQNYNEDIVIILSYHQPLLQLHNKAMIKKTSNILHY